MHCQQTSTGFKTLRTPSENKGLAFTEEQRAELKLTGLLPAAVSSMELETARAMAQLRRKSSPLEKYIFMQTMQVREPCKCNAMQCGYIAIAVQ